MKDLSPQSFTVVSADNIKRLGEQVLPFLQLIKLRIRANLLLTLRGTGFTKGMSGVGQDPYDDPIELFADACFDVAHYRFCFPAKREPACPTEQTPEVKPQDTA